MNFLLLAGVILGVGIAAAKAADDCPTQQSASKGFVVERGERSKTEVFHSGPTEVRTVYRVNDRALLEVTLFQGLFELERLDRGKRSVYRPISDLAKTFPPIPGKKVAAIFEETEGDGKNARTIVLEVRKEPDTLSIGPCRYKVLRIDRSRMVEGRKESVFMSTDYYAPDLKLILGKEFRDRDGRTTLNKFDRIYPLAR